MDSGTLQQPVAKHSVSVNNFIPYYITLFTTRRLTGSTYICDMCCIISTSTGTHATTGYTHCHKHKN